MLIEFAPFVGRHRKDKRFPDIPLLILLPFGHIQGRQRGVEMEVKFLRVTRLAIGQTCELLRIPKNKFDLEAGAVSLIELNRVKLYVSGEQQGVAQPLIMFVIDQIDDPNLSLEVNRPNDGCI